MRYRYRSGGQEYVVRLVDYPPSVAGLATAVRVEVEFVARINGGRGRMPKTKEVLVSELEPLVDFEAARKLVKG